MKILAINFTVELEADNKLAFMDTEIRRVKKEILSQKYFGLKHTNIYFNFDSHYPIANKCDVVRTKKNRAERICTDKKDLGKELECIHEVLSQNGCPKRFIIPLSIFDGSFLL